MTAETENTPGTSERKRGGARKLVGILLATIGFLWLSKKIGWLPVEHGHPAILWPIVVIALGLFLFLGSRHNRKT